MSDSKVTEVNREQRIHFILKDGLSLLGKLQHFSHEELEQFKKWVVEKL